MGKFTSKNTHILATHVQKDGNKRMLLFHICESGRHEYVVGSYFTEELEYIEPGGQFPSGVTVNRQGDCFDEATGRYIGQANNFLSYQDADYYAAALESSREHGKTIHYTWDWGHYFSDVVDAVEYWRTLVLCDE